MANFQSNAPVIIQAWNDGSMVSLQPSTGKLYRGTPRVGIAVGTFAAVPYIHLQLEARRRFYPNVPILVHDDGSHKIAPLRTLCREYGCDLEYNGHRQPPCLGDLSVFVGGLTWAAHLKIDILVKVSRRWLFQTNWEPSLKALAVQSQYATFASYTTSFDFGFRTECVALAVAVWGAADFMEDAMAHISRGRSVFVEGYFHEFARKFERKNCEPAERWREAHPMTEDRNGYALWTLLGTDRCQRSPYFLWHDSCTPQDYLQIALNWGLPYALEDFLDPNEGGGSVF